MAKPLDGIRVLDLSRFIAGPQCAALLGMQGADVIKVERIAGEDSRQNGPFVEGKSIYFTTYNQAKRGIALNLRSDEGKQLLWELIRVSEVLVENFRPGTLDQMGFPWERIEAANPRLVLTSISGFGQHGPYRDRAAFDAIAQAMSGLMSLAGSEEMPPMLAGTFVADFTAALYAALGTMFALFERERSGRGQRTDVALVDSVVSILGTALPDYLATGRVQPREGNRDRVTGPGDAFPARDGWVYLHAGTDGLWPRLARAMGREDLAGDPRFATVDARMGRVDEVAELVAQWTRQHSKADIVAAGEKYGFPCSEVATIADVAANPQLAIREMAVKHSIPGIGEVAAAGCVTKLSRTPAGVWGRAPLLGEHSREVVCELLGHSEDEYERLLSKGVVAEATTELAAATAAETE